MMDYSCDTGSMEVSEPIQNFGGDWITEKLEAVFRYLGAYLNVLKNQPQWQKIYVDDFAGTGRVEKRTSSRIAGPSGEALFPEMVTETAERVLGSTSRALTLEPGFSKYIFIEQSRKKVVELKTLASRYPDKQVEIIQSDANEELKRLAGINWRSNRALVFLDPFGMQVKWDTLVTLANTRAVDLWYLFPLGVGVNRLLQNDGLIPGYNQIKLDEMFGTTEWRKVFYKQSKQVSLFGEESSSEKQGDFDGIEKFFVERLSSIFPYVSAKPRRLYNSTGNPLYSLCFAAANPGVGGKTALKIANHLLTNLKKR